jgi:hypothetical protein
VLIATLENEFAVLTPVDAVHVFPVSVENQIPFEASTTYWPEDDIATTPALTAVIDPLPTYHADATKGALGP